MTEWPSLFSCLHGSDAVLNFLVGPSFDADRHSHSSDTDTIIFHNEHLFELFLVPVLFHRDRRHFSGPGQDRIASNWRTAKVDR